MPRPELLAAARKDARRERLLDMEHRVRRYRAACFGILALALASAGPEIGWLWLAPLGAGFAGFAVADRFMQASERPWLWVAAAWGALPLLLAGAVIASGGPTSPVLMWFALPAVTLGARFDPWGMVVGTIYLLLVFLASTVAEDQLTSAADEGWIRDALEGISGGFEEDRVVPVGFDKHGALHDLLGRADELADADVVAAMVRCGLFATFKRNGGLLRCAALELKLGELAVGDVEHHPVPALAPVRVGQQHGFVADPDGAPVAVADPVFVGRRRLDEVLLASEHLLAILGVHLARPQTGVGHPLLGCEARDRLGARADVVPGAVDAGVGDVDDRRQQVDQRPGLELRWERALAVTRERVAGRTV